jgi:hypothetical protein
MGQGESLHDVDMKPICALLHRPCAIRPELGEVSRQDGGGNDSVGRHCEVDKKRLSWQAAPVNALCYNAGVCKCVCMLGCSHGKTKLCCPPRASLHSLV